MTVGILQARMSSSRLPGKVLKPILGQPMLQRQLERLQRAETLDKLIVATSDRADDQIIASLCGKLGIECYRGSMDDVLDRLITISQEEYYIDDSEMDFDETELDEIEMVATNDDFWKG